jgi:DNA-binding SARP family transcriptional activator
VGVEFGILGPLQALVDGTPVALGGRQQRAVLAILLVQANQTVPVDRLIDDVWGDSPPETAGNLLQGYVSQLRKALGTDVIATRGRGYAVIIPTGGLDLHRFEQRAEAGMAERSTGSAERASAELTTALALWRGPALSDVADLPGIAAIAARLDALRLAAIEHRLEADLDCGREDEVAAELDALIAEHPLRERLRRLRMLALYRAGRQAEALEAYRAARETLVEELGIEPSEELGELERAILRRDPDLLPRSGALALVPEAPVQTRTVLIAALAMRSVATLLALGGSLARRPDRELVLASTVSRSEDLLEVTKRLREATAPLGEQGVVARVAAFTSVVPGRLLDSGAAAKPPDSWGFHRPASFHPAARQRQYWLRASRSTNRCFHCGLNRSPEVPPGNQTERISGNLRERQALDQALQHPTDEHRGIS